ncbi:cytochrome P450 [Paractinoplanes rishiriensis]|uniref:Methyl-branched lipid omega-hydroxylase n=1 Tax=Paractinoplanes rishiriensis TaxID=1050105 RepID=A0A919JQS6_9ACTN|nr:cytochrome P450 [Actinoplanes rishiriensis]GIE93043.1 methyl-branched lipid omega-hydroxylase [Actinoplanes rishiriensis]
MKRGAQPTPVALDEVDLTDLDRFRDNLGWGQFDTLRREDPVHWHPEPAPNGGFWALTRHADIRAASRDADAHRSLPTDDPRQTAVRALIAREFRPHRLRQNYGAFLRELTKNVVCAALTEPEFDFVQRISADFPIQVLSRLLDVPKEVTRQLVAWSNAAVGITEHLPCRSPTTQDVIAYGRALRNARRRGDGKDLVSILVNRVPADGVPLTEREFDSYFLRLLKAGNETTQHALSNSMLGLIEQPGQLRLLRDNPDLLRTGVEELLRWASPVYHVRRTAPRDVQVAGRLIRAGDEVVMWFASGNRDADVFTDPYRIDVTRPKVDHLAFGRGSPQVCLGKALARLEIRLMYEELLPRLDSVELASEVTRVRSNLVNGITTLLVKVRSR